MTALEHAEAAVTMRRAARLRRLLGRVLTHATLMVGALVVSLPFVWMISTSLKKPSQVFLYPPKWIPDPIMWSNYSEAMTVVPFGLYAKNTLIIVSLTLVGQVLSSSLVAFSFARLRWKGRDMLFLLVLATMMLPSQVTLIPTFILFRYLGWINTLAPMIVPAFFGAPFYVFLLRQFFMTIPIDMDESARIDGAGTLRIFWQILVPLAKPAMAAVAIFSFQGHWNDFFTPLIYLLDRSKYTLALGLRTFQGQYDTDYHLLMAAAFVVMLPILLVFFFAQKYFIQGVVFTGVKG